MVELSNFVKTRRKQLGLKQEEFAEKAGVALTVIRKIEQGKENLNLSKVNQILLMFGHVLGPIIENHARQARVKTNNIEPGLLTEDDNGDYLFV